MDKSSQKRLIIGLIYLIFFAAVFWFLYSIFKPKATCTDGVKNQNEEGIDCGGICPANCVKNEVKDFIVGETGVVESSIAGQYDFYGQVINPNNTYGSKSFSYDIRFKDENGLILAERQGESFILPGDKKYIIENNIGSDKHPISIDFSVTDSQWVETDDLYERPDLEIVNKSYNEITSGVGFSEAKGLLKNKSPFDFALIRVRVILRDMAGKIIALNSTEMRTVRSGENRDYRAFWPNRFPGGVADVENQVEVNVFDSDAFAKKYFQSLQSHGR
ncbi:MAG: hypothetical protein WC848_06095 [Parcubacteria group bacterium]|jgi:hypothetical protein